MFMSFKVVPYNIVEKSYDQQTMSSHWDTLWNKTRNSISIKYLANLAVMDALFLSAHIKVTYVVENSTQRQILRFIWSCFLFVKAIGKSVEMYRAKYVANDCQVSYAMFSYGI